MKRERDGEKKEDKIDNCAYNNQKAKQISMTYARRETGKLPSCTK